MQTARHLVGITVKLTASMQLSHNHLGRRHAFFSMHINRYTAAVIGHRHRPVSIQLYLHNIAMACQRLVNRIVDNLIDHMVQARPIISIANIHAWAFTHRVQPAQHLDRIGAIVIFRKINFSIGHHTTSIIGACPAVGASFNLTN